MRCMLVRWWAGMRMFRMQLLLWLPWSKLKKRSKDMKIKRIKQKSYFYLFLVFLISSCAFAQEDITVHEMMEKFRATHNTDKFEQVAQMKKLINKYQESESVLYLYNKMFQLYYHFMYLENLIDKKKYEELKRGNARKGLECYHYLKRKHNGKLGLGVYERYAAEFYENLEKWEKAENIYNQIIKEDRDLLPGVKFPFKYLVWNLIMQKKYEKAAELFNDKLTLRDKKRIIKRDNEFYDYCLKNNLLNDDLKLSEDDYHDFMWSNKLSQKDWQIPKDLKIFHYQNLSEEA